MTATDAEKQHPEHPDNSDQGNHGEKTATIIVNTREYLWEEKGISFEQVFKLAYPEHQIVEVDDVTVQYSRGPNEKPKGSLSPNRSVKVKNKMVFDVYLTTRS
jgi:hypothetical protein